MYGKHEFVRINGGRESEKWDPFRELHGLKNSISRLSDDAFKCIVKPDWGQSAFGMKGAWVPRIEVQETDKEYVLTADLPGMDKKDIHVEIKHDVLTVSGERKSEKEENRKNFLKRELSYGSFSRSLAFPENLKTDGVKAHYKDGVLSLRIPRVEGAKRHSAKVNVE